MVQGMKTAHTIYLDLQATVYFAMDFFCNLFYIFLINQHQLCLLCLAGKIYRFTYELTYIILNSSITIVFDTMQETVRFLSIIVFTGTRGVADMFRYFKCYFLCYYMKNSKYKCVTSCLSMNICWLRGRVKRSVWDQYLFFCGVTDPDSDLQRIPIKLRIRIWIIFIWILNLSECAGPFLVSFPDPCASKATL